MRARGRVAGEVTTPSSSARDHSLVTLDRALGVTLTWKGSMWSAVWMKDMVSEVCPFPLLSSVGSAERV